MPKPRRHPCGRCGRRQPADAMVYSRFTAARYCLAVDECDRRVDRRRAREAREHREKVTA